jgi:hypothetical protein
MNTVLTKWMTLFISITIMFTPILMYFDSYNKSAVDQVLQQGLKEASIEGAFTEDIENKMIGKLTSTYNFDINSITDVSGTPGTVPRGGFITAEITVKRSPIFIINIFNNGSNTYTKNGTIMSESIQ